VTHLDRVARRTGMASMRARIFEEIVAWRADETVPLASSKRCASSSSTSTVRPTAAVSPGATSPGGIRSPQPPESQTTAPTRTTTLAPS
jgi:hypothetical protein